MTPAGQLCQLCETLEADVVDVVESDESGRRMEVALCDPCHRKTIKYADDESVSFDDELRLRNRGGSSD